VETIKAFIAAMQTGEAGKLAPVSLGMVVGALCRMGTAFAPQKDWTWLKRIYARLKFRAVPSRAKHLRVVAAADVYRLGIELMETAHRLKSPFRQATQYRIGLQIALWIARPLRIRNFQDLALGTTLVKRGDLYWLVFSERQTKTGRPIELPVPAQLMPYFDRYLYEHRPFLGTRHGKKTLSTALWLGRDGEKQEEASIRENLERRTREKFGRPINPHLLRDCAATSFALEDPENVRCTMLVLGHTLMSTTERYYNQARSVEASRTYGGAFAAMRERFTNYVPPEPPDVPK
jgi:integrase